MDPISLAVYAVVCGLLSAAGPVLGPLPVRFGVGVVVGLVASWIVPMLQGMAGY